MAEQKALWGISLAVVCHKCEACFDLVATDDELFHCVEACEARKDYEVTCPTCGAEFTVDMVY